MSSGHNRRFLENPLQYLREVLVIPNDRKFDGRTPAQSMLHFRGGANPALQPRAQIYVDLVAIDGSWFSSNATVVRPDFSTTPPGGDDEIVGAYAPYIVEGTVNANPQAMGRIALPPAGVPRFAFTGAVNGCSFVLCNETATGNKIALHYPNSTGSTQGYPHLATLGLTHVKSIDFFDTGGTRGLQKSYSSLGIGANTDDAATIAGNRQGWFNAFVFMLNIAGVWHVVGQPMFCTMGTNGLTTGRPNGNPILV